MGHGGGELRGLQAGDSASWPHGASCLAREVDAAAGEGGRRALPLVGASGAVWGAAMCGPTSRKPVYVSVGAWARGRCLLLQSLCELSPPAAVCLCVCVTVL